MKNKLYGIVSILMMFFSYKLSAGSGEFAVQVHNKPSSISISSGTYFYRVYIGTDLLNGRLQLVK